MTTHKGIELQYTVFPDVKPKHCESVCSNWGEFVSALQEPQVYRDKESCPLLKLATFGDTLSEGGILRHDANMLELFGIEGDYDGELVTLDQAAALLEAQGIEALLVTSANHCVLAPPKYNGGPRWRVLCPLSKPVSPTMHRELVAALNWALGGILATESFTLSQPYYFGQVAGVLYETRHVRGEPLDLLAFLLGETYPTQHRDDKSQRSASGEDDFARTASMAGITTETLEDLRDATMNGLKPNRAEDRTMWIDVGLALYSLEQAGYSDEARALWHDFSQRCADKYDPEQAERTWETFNPSKITYKSIFEWAQADGWKNPKKRTPPTAETRLDRTDAGNLALLAGHVVGNLRFVTELKTWLWWDGHRWCVDSAGTMAQAVALQVGEHYYLEAQKLRAQAAGGSLDAKERKRIERAADSVEAWASQCRNKSRIDNMLNLAKGDSRFALSVSALDRDPYLFGANNGVIDLRTGHLRAVGRDDYVTKRSPVAFNPSATAPRWLQFIAEITSQPPATQRTGLAAYLQRALGYCMTGSTAEHKMFMAIGAGSNGKNVLLDLLQWVLGDYCETIAPEALMASKHDADAERPTPGARKLAGARVAISSESKDGQRLDVALVKRHTGGGYLTARGLHENAFRFEITHKLWLMTNHKPALDHMDDAMRGRLHMIPFDMRWNRPGHPERDSKMPDGDKTLPDKLRQEAEGVLAWLVSGAVAYHRYGLEPPTEVVNMTRSYFEEQDPFSQWLSECEASTTGTLAAELLTNFRDWCSAEGFGASAAGNPKAFGLRLAGAGVSGTRAKEGKRYSLKPAPLASEFL